VRGALIPARIYAARVRCVWAAGIGGIAVSSAERPTGKWKARMDRNAKAVEISLHILYHLPLTDVEEPR